MKTIEYATSNFSKIDKINSRNGVALKECDGLTIKVKALATGTDADENGEVRNVGVIVTPENEYYTTISGSAIDVIDDSIELIDEGMELSLRITKRTSSKGREFITLTAITS